MCHPCASQPCIRSRKTPTTIFHKSGVMLWISGSSFSPPYFAPAITLIQVNLGLICLEDLFFSPKLCLLFQVLLCKLQPGCLVFAADLWFASCQIQTCLLKNVSDIWDRCLGIYFIIMGTILLSIAVEVFLGCITFNKIWQWAL